MLAGQRPGEDLAARVARADVPQELRGGATGEMARARAERRVRAFLRRTVEGCLGLAELDRRYNLRASVQHGAVTAAMNETDMASLRAAYEFMEKSSLRALMPADDKRRPPFFKILSARQVESRYGTAQGFYAGGVIDDDLASGGDLVVWVPGEERPTVEGRGLGEPRLVQVPGGWYVTVEVVDSPYELEAR